jgi:hypothetical protein
MTDRKPPGVSFETWVDRQVRSAEDRGEFENLPGKGKPIADLDAPHDELWWVKRKLKEEGISYLPPALAIRRELEITREAIARAETEEQVRTLVESINTRIRHVNRTAISGPPTTVMPQDPDEVIAKWRTTREGATPAK